MESLSHTLAFFAGMPGWTELLVIASIGLLLFGKRLPEVGRSLGKGIVEFKKGLKGIETDVEDAVERAERPASSSSAKADNPIETDSYEAATDGPGSNDDDQARTESTVSTGTP